MQGLLARDIVTQSCFDMCQFGLVTQVTRTPMQKRARLGSNIPEIHSAFRNKFCKNLHAHQAISGHEGSMRCSVWAAKYPAEMCTTLAKAIQVHLRNKGMLPEDGEDHNDVMTDATSKMGM